MFILVKHALLCQRLCRNQCQPSLQKNDKLMLLPQPALQRSALLDITRFIRFFTKKKLAELVLREEDILPKEFGTL